MQLYDCICIFDVYIAFSGIHVLMAAGLSERAC